jgi:signal transduction histidine kinase
MFIPASSEFVALCKSQVAVLTQALGAALSAVYLTEELVEGVEPKLIPVVVYPEATVWEAEETSEVLPELQGEISKLPRLLKAAPRLLPQGLGNDSESNSNSAERIENYLRQQRQVVLPLIHEGVVMGLLVTARDDRPWNEQEKATIERIAGTLTLAYIMDQRRAWMEEELTQSRQFQAQQRDRLDDLLHQFRNPMTAIRTFGKLLFRRLQPGDKNQEAAASIVGESDRLQELLQQFDACLDLTEEMPIILKASPLLNEASQQPVTPPGLSLLPSNAQMQEAVSVRAVLAPLVISAMAMATERNLTLITAIPEQLPLVQGNAKALREVLSNLIDNALKYTPSGGQIEIRVGVGQTDRGAMTAIAISDTGPGIPPQDLEHLFERHYRGVQAATAIPGSGLGLAIAKELIAQMQGQIEVFSPAQTVWTKQNSDAFNQSQANLVKGTTFVVWLSSIL